MIKFTKMHGLGNDFVILDGRAEGMALSLERRRHIADRKRGVGCDQLIVMAPAQNTKADIFMRIYNPDGGEAGACGNATRCVADIIMREKESEFCIIETVAGLLKCARAENDLIAVEMGAPRLNWQDIPLSKECDTLHLPLDGDPVSVNMGNPHCVFFVDDLSAVDVATCGAKIEVDPLFPDRTNVEFVEVLSRDHLKMRVWERGAGITQSCGSGACAVAVAAIRRGVVTQRESITVSLDGGDLVIDWVDDTAPVTMTGPVAYVFEGLYL